MSCRFVASIGLILFHVTALKCHGVVNGKNFGARMPYASANAIRRLRILVALKVGRRMGGWRAVLLVVGHDDWRAGMRRLPSFAGGAVAIFIWG